MLRQALYDCGSTGYFQSACAFRTQQKACRELRALLEQTVLNGERHSLLLVGPRGSGKSWVVEDTFRELSSNPKCKGNFIKVYLNGLIHTDDRLALLDIAHQLQVETNMDESLHLSYASALNYLLTTVHSGGRASKSVIFILDSFDLFTHHKNQMLLCNLFDFTRSANTPIAIVGLTRRLDVTEMLEKRLRSRYSHRQILLLCDYRFEEYMEISRSLLSLPDSFTDKAYLKEWRLHLEELLKSPKVVTVLRKQHAVSPNLHTLKSLLMLPVCKLGISGQFLDPVHFLFAYSMVNQDSMSVMLRGVSILELCLVIAMKQLVKNTGAETFNFEMVYDEYRRFTNQVSSHSVEFFSKPVAMKAFEHLISLEFVYPEDGGSSCIQREYQPVVLLLMDGQIEQAVLNYPNCPTDVVQWATNKISHSSKAR
eukprot:Em0023g811a